VNIHFSNGRVFVFHLYFEFVRNFLHVVSSDKVPFDDYFSFDFEWLMSKVDFFDGEFKIQLLVLEIV
jgi:hypothetical protein